MPAIPEEFFIPLTTVKGVSTSTAEFQHLLNHTSVLAARDITIDDAQRYSLLRELASALAFLHNHGVCVGDISPKNLLFTLKPHEAVYFIDCDAMRINAVSALPQVETPGWDTPPGEERATVYSDTYKLGLLALRLLAGDHDTKDPQHLPSTTPGMLRQIITDTLTNPPHQRPLPEAWTYVLGHAIEEAQHHQKAAAAAEAPVAVRDTPPIPVVHSRPSTPTTQSKPPTRPPASATAATNIGPLRTAAFVQNDKSPARRRRRTATIAVIVGTVVAFAAVVVVFFTDLPSRLLGKIHHPPGTVLPFTGLKQPVGVAVDGTGTIYVVDCANRWVLKQDAGSTGQTVLPFTDLSWPVGVAVDKSGSVYVTDTQSNRVLKLGAGASTPTVLPFTGLNYPDGVAVDTTGTVYVADEQNGRVLRLAPGASEQTVLPFAGLGHPANVAVDSAGSLYVTDGAGNARDSRVWKWAASSSTQTLLPFTDFTFSPTGVAVDSTGNVYVSDVTRVRKLAVGASAPTIAFTNVSAEGLAMDNAGNLYATSTDVSAPAVRKLTAG